MKAQNICAKHSEVVSIGIPKSTGKCPCWSVFATEIYSLSKCELEYRLNYRKTKNA